MYIYKVRNFANLRINGQNSSKYKTWYIFELKKKKKILDPLGKNCIKKDNKLENK